MHKCILSLLLSVLLLEVDVHYLANSCVELVKDRHFRSFSKEVSFFIKIIFVCWDGVIRCLS